MTISKNLAEDIKIIFEKINLFKISSKEFRQLCDSLDRTFSLIVRQLPHEHSEEEYNDIMNYVDFKLDGMLKDVDELKTKLLEENNFRYHYDVLIGYEKLIRIQQFIKDKR